MPLHVYKAWNKNESPRRFAVEVEFHEDRWVAWCREVHEGGDERPDAPPVAPKFYGVTGEQARRRTVDALANTYDEVEAVEGDLGD